MQLETGQRFKGGHRDLCGGYIMGPPGVFIWDPFLGGALKKRLVSSVGPPRPGYFDR